MQEVRIVGRKAPFDMEAIFVIHRDDTPQGSRPAQYDAPRLELGVLQVELEMICGERQAKIPDAQPGADLREAVDVGGEGGRASLSLRHEFVEEGLIEITFGIHGQTGGRFALLREEDFVGGVTKAFDGALGSGDHRMPHQVMGKGLGAPQNAVALAPRGDISDVPRLLAKQRCGQGVGVGGEKDVAIQPHDGREVSVRGAGAAGQHLVLIGT